MTRFRNPGQTIRPLRRPRPPLRGVAPLPALLATLSLGLTLALALPVAVVRPAAGQVAGQGAEHDAVLEQHRKQRANQYKSLERFVETMDVLPLKKLDDVLRLKMDGRHLALVSLLTTAGHSTGNFRVNFDGFKGPTYVQVSLRGVVRLGVGPAAIAQEKMLTFVNYDLPNPDEMQTLSVTAYPSYLMICRDSRVGAGGSRTIRLIQNRPADVQPAPGGAAAAAAGGGLVQLFVSESGDAVTAGAIPRTFNLQAPDFQTLLREHAREADEFIRPLLRQIGQEAVLAPDEQIAWQVLSDRWRPDPGLVRKVRELLPSLNDGDFHARDKALAEIQQMGKSGAAVLLHLDRRGLTPEQNLAIDRTLAPFAQLTPKEAARLRDDTDFLLDCLYGSDHDVRAAALDRLKQVTDKDVSFDLDAPDSDRRSAVSALRGELARKPGPAAGPTTQPARS